GWSNRSASPVRPPSDPPRAWRLLLRLPTKTLTTREWYDLTLREDQGQIRKNSPSHTRRGNESLRSLVAAMSRRLAVREDAAGAAGSATVPAGPPAFPANAANSVKFAELSAR